MGEGEIAEAYLPVLRRRTAIGLFVRAGAFELPHYAQDQFLFPIRKARAPSLSPCSCRPLTAWCEL